VGDGMSNWPLEIVITTIALVLALVFLAILVFSYFFGKVNIRLYRKVKLNVSDEVIECNQCGQKLPAYLMSTVQVWSRQYVGKVRTCDFCYRSESVRSDHDLRERAHCYVNYKGFLGAVRWMLRESFERSHSDIVQKAVGDLIISFKNGKEKDYRKDRA
jgi:hypothetical protein